MTLHAVVDDREFGQVATMKGWSDFTEWADAQPYFELAHLAYHGYSTKLEVLANEIAQAIMDSNPRSDIKSTARGIEKIARDNADAEVMVVSDGVGVTS